MTTSPDQPLLVSVPEAARVLSVSHPTVQRMIADGRLPARHIGRRVLIPWSALQALAEDGDA